MRADLLRHMSEDLDEVQEQIERVLNGESAGSRTEIVPLGALYKRDLRSIRFNDNSGSFCFAVDRVRHTPCQTTIVTGRPAMVICFPYKGPALVSISHPSGHGSCIYGYHSPHVARIPDQSDSLNIVIGETVFRRLARTFGDEPQPLDCVARLLMWADKGTTERLAIRIWQTFKPSFRDENLATGSIEACENWLVELEDALFKDLHDYLHGKATFRLDPSAMLLSQCQELLSTIRVRAVSTRELAEGVGASQQRIYDSFLAIAGMSPRDWHLHQRLGHVRAGLKRASPYSKTVAEIAGAYGFKHLGRFSEIYRRAFREYPSATLKYG